MQQTASPTTGAAIFIWNFFRHRPIFEMAAAEGPRTVPAAARAPA